MKNDVKQINSALISKNSIEFFRKDGHYFAIQGGKTSRDLEGSIEKMIEKNHKKIIEDSFLNRFDGIEISSKTLCEIWNVTPATLSSYVKFKVIIPVNPGSSKLLFNLKQNHESTKKTRL